MAEGNIGSVGVSVVPDASAFWTRFVEQTRPGATRAGAELGAGLRDGMQAELDRGVNVRADTTGLNRQIGELGARLRAAGDQFRIDPSGLGAAQLASITSASNRLADANQKLTAARQVLDEVTRREGHTEEELAAATNVVTRAQRDQELAALRLAAAEEAVASAQRRQAESALKAAAANETVGKSSANAGGGMRNLLIAAAALAPALIPIGAVAIPALATLALGAKTAGAEIKKGLTDEFHHLQTAAGVALTPGIHDLIGAVQKAQPQLQQLVGVFGTALSGEISKFSDSLNNGGLSSFISYAKQELPIVLDTFNQILSAVGAIGKALTPIGNSILVDLDYLARFTTSLTDLLDKIGGLKAAQGLVDDLGIVTKMADQVTKMADQLSSIKIPEVSFGNFDLGGGSLGGLNDFYTKWISPQGQIGQVSKLLGSGFDKLFGADTIAGQGHLSQSARDAAAALKAETDMLNAAADAATRYDAAVAKASVRVSLAQSQSAFVSAARGVADALRSGSNSLDGFTAKGLANRDALLSAAKAALTYYDTQRKNKVGAVQAAQALLGDVEALRATAIHGGAAKGSVDGLLRSLHLLPKQVSTLLTVDASQAYAVLDYLQAQYAHLGEPNGGATTVSSISFNRPPATSPIPGVKPGTPYNPTPISPTPLTPKTPKTPTTDPMFTKLIAELQKVRAARQQEIQTIRTAITGTFDITTVGNNQFGEPVTLFDIQAGLKQALQNANQFVSVLKRLAREGLNQTLLAQLAEAGPGALPQAQALLSATPKQLAKINREYRQLATAGTQLGRFIGNDMYQSGIQAADGLVRGLRSKKSALTETMKDLAQSMIRELRRELNPNYQGPAHHHRHHKALQNRPAAYSFNALTPNTGGTPTFNQVFNNPVPEPASRSQNAAMRAARNALGARP